MKTFFKATSALALLATATAATAEPFVVNVSQPPSTMDPAFACDIVGNGYIAPLYAPLVSYGRENLSGPDGVSVTAEDDLSLIHI